MRAQPAPSSLSLHAMSCGPDLAKIRSPDREIGAMLLMGSGRCLSQPPLMMDYSRRGGSSTFSSAKSASSRGISAFPIIYRHSTEGRSPPIPTVRVAIAPHDMQV
jgi:hypothetical protein